MRMNSHYSNSDLDNRRNFFALPYLINAHDCALDRIPAIHFPRIIVSGFELWNRRRYPKENVNELEEEK